MNGKRLLAFLGATGIAVWHTVRGIEKIRHIGPCSPELEYRCDKVRENQALIDEYRKVHGDTTSSDFEIYDRLHLT